jgi:hypothetical protein
MKSLFCLAVSISYVNRHASCLLDTSAGASDPIDKEKGRELVVSWNRV